MMNKRANLGLPARHQNSKNTGTREFMDKLAVLSLSPDLDSLKARESVLRSNGLKVISVMSAIQARYATVRKSSPADCSISGKRAASRLSANLIVTAAVMLSRDVA